MADTKTTHLELIKQDPNKAPDIAKEHSNLDKLDEEVYKRAKSVNGVQTGEDGGIQLRMVPYAENLETSASQSSDEEFIIRTTGGDASLEDGDAWLTLLRGSRKHTGYTAQSVDMSVIPMARPVPAAITAELNIATFEAYVQQAGTYTISYTDSWSTSPATYGITVSNTPIDGDSITVVWDGENDPVMTVNAVERTAPPAITATIDVATFVSYVSQSGTTTLTYSTAWSADPANYGITVTNDPIAGDVIQVIYVKEVRGLITQSTPETFVSTGWNLYDHSKGYARLIKYSTQYNFKISGTYTALEFAETLSGTRQTITPVSGAFSIPSDGYLFVTGGNNTDTVIWMTWSDWGMGYNWNSTTGQQGAFAPYTEDVIDISTFMANNFPYGLMQVGTVRDEINLNIGIATSRVVRQAYNATNLANAKASGRQYEYDENYIYIERETAVYYTIEVDGGYAAYDHGMELFTGTEQAVYTQTLYGQNLKNKLERDVLTISQQSLSTAEQAQVRANLDAAKKIDSVWYGTCDTAASTQAKTASIDGFPTSLVAGLKVRLKFTNAQTYNGQPTLKINSLTAKNICRFGTTAAARYEWQAGQVLDLIYDGSNWIIVDGELANGNYPGKVKLSNAYTSSGGAAADGVAASSKAVYDAYTALNSKIHSKVMLITQTININEGLDYANVSPQPGYVLIGASRNSDTGTTSWETWTGFVTGVIAYTNNGYPSIFFSKNAPSGGANIGINLVFAKNN